MGIFGGDKDDPTTGSGRGGTLGTPDWGTAEEPPGNDGDTMVVRGGGVADASEDGATAAGDRGLG